MVPQETGEKTRLLAKLVRDLLRSESFESLADLTDAFKSRCARLKIRWTNDEISAAYRLVETNTPLPGIRLPRCLEERPAEGAIIDRSAAARFMRDLPGLIKAVRKAPWTDPAAVAEEHEAARLRALVMGIEL